MIVNLTQVHINEGWQSLGSIQNYTDSRIQLVSKTVEEVLRLARFSYNFTFKNQHKYWDKGNHAYDLECQVTISPLKI